ncbi:MAG: flagellar basal body P-ring protein FlgI [Planctomycetaceae bacterium]
MNTPRPLTELSGTRIRVAAVRRLLPVTVVLCGICGCASGLLNVTGANSFGSKFAGMLKDDESEQQAARKDDNDFETRVETPLLGDYTSVTGNNMVALRGVGLVTGLNGSGGDPPPSHLRQELINEMGRRKIPNPARILASPNTALVIVTAYLPAMVREGQTFDVRVALPPNSAATSLKGGWLLETRLSEEQNIPGKGNIKGHQYAVAHGAILTALGADGASKINSAMLRRGSIPGGAVSKTERDLEMIIRNEYRGLKTAKAIENAVSHRLHHYNRFGQRIPMAEAKTDTRIELKVHPLYRNNFPRYQQMIRSIAFRETDIAGRMRVESLSRELLQPETTARAALQLEAIGRDSISFLKAALASPESEVRFHAAQALAYLEDSSGAQVLKEAAENEPAFRVYALAALSVIDDADGILALRELLNSDALETRYGAVRALKENNPQDSSLGTIEFPHQFILHAVESTGPPAAHVVRYRSPEVVVFGTQQELRMPATLLVGDRIRIKGDAGDKEVTITKYELDAEPVRQTSSTNLVEILRTVGTMGANYPDVVQMLLEAENQGNLAGELGIDRLPQAGRVFLRSHGQAEETPEEARLGTASLTPGLFDRVEDSDADTTDEDSSALARMFANRSPEDEEALDRMADSSTSEDDNSEKADSGAKIPEEPATDKPEEMDMRTLERIESHLSEDGDSNDDFVPEKTEFREPMTSKIRRAFFSPFQKQD